MKACPHCGKELPEEMQFCPYCMEKLVEETPVGGTPAKKHPLWWLWLIAAAVLLMALLLWLLWPEAEPSATPTGAGDAADLGGTHATDLGGRDSTTDGTDTDPSGESEGKSTPPTDTTDTAGKIDPVAGSTTDPTTTTHKNDTTKTGTTKTTAKTDKTTPKTGKQTSTTKKPTSSTASATGNPCAAGHAWTDLVETVHHEEKGHYEKQATGSTRVTVYQCAVCYQTYDSLDDYYTHFDTHLATSDPLVEIFQDRYETDTETRPVYKQVWVVDQEAYDETVTVGRRCQRCGKTEENQ